ncbi:MAG: type II toxin-antitoxin system RelE/ParE family toxin [Candidatus Magasanikbacteria bacterium]|nr:type II toxin-antitoxin system RelE/ParE family toxin [Candidatus Magasanikbacteria bacterium]
MAWQWIIDGKAAKNLKKLPMDGSSRIINKLDYWVGSGKPSEFAENLTNSELGGYRFRVGDYRIIFDVEGENIVVLAVGHRREIYK